MCGEALTRRQAPWVIHQGCELVEESAPSDRGTVGGHIARVATFTHGERMLHDGVDPLGPGSVRMIRRQFATAAKQMRQTV